MTYSVLSPSRSHRTLALLVGMTAFCTSASFLLADSEAVPQVATRVTSNTREQNHKLLAAIQMARTSLEQMATVKDYEATFHKREIVGRKLITQRIRLRLREKPFSVYLQFIAPHSGREVIFVEGKNGGNLLAHGTGLEALIGTVKLPPNSRDALQESRYPVTMVGMSNMLETTIHQWESEIQYLDTEVKYFPNAKLGNVECTVIQTSHPKHHDGVPFHMTRLYFEKESNLPIRVEQYGFPTRSGGEPVLIEEYTYLNVKTNVHLTDTDFDTSNPAYDF